MFAVIKTGGKQYLVTPGEKLKVEKIEPEKGENLVFDSVLLTENDGKIEIGVPLVKNAKVEAKIVEQGRHDKLIVFRYHSKVRYRKKRGHRQPFTEVEIRKISL